METLASQLDTNGDQFAANAEAQLSLVRELKKRLAVAALGGSLNLSGDITTASTGSTVGNVLLVAGGSGASINSSKADLVINTSGNTSGGMVGAVAPSGINFGASDPRADGAAVPERPKASEQ